MLMYSDYFVNIPCERTFFAGANTPQGFVPAYDDMISEDIFERIYIIKGGSGTGKSTIIRKCADAARGKGARVTDILCSSDPDSLDGIIIEKDEHLISVIDGTAPHTMDAKYPGACGEIFDCGRFWSSTYLENKKSDIARHTEEKKAAYQTSYRFLSAAGEAISLEEGLALYCFDKKKARNAAEKLCSVFGKLAKEGQCNFRRTMAISMKGAFRLGTFDRAERLFALEDHYFQETRFFELILEVMLSRGYDAFVSLSPLGGIGELYFPECRCAFVSKREGMEYERIINLRRFADKDKVAKTKQKRIFCSKCLSSMLEGAADSLKLAGEHHFALEEIYKEAMDFSALSCECDRLCDDIRKRLSREGIH
ncbi:MAG: hypothetical protein IJ046_00580 [Clostridia bacterium]|nr:hypothetical protein [Clostridia bacterium]